MQTAQINDLRSRILKGETVTPEELEEALAITRAQRAAAPSKKAKPTLPDGFDLNDLFAKKEEPKNDNA